MVLCEYVRSIDKLAEPFATCIFVVHFAIRIETTPHTERLCLRCFALRLRLCAAALLFDYLGYIGGVNTDYMHTLCTPRAYIVVPYRIYLHAEW